MKKLRMFYIGPTKLLKDAGLKFFSGAYSTPKEEYESIWFNNKYKNKRLISIGDVMYPSNGDKFLYDFIINLNPEEKLTVNLSPRICKNGIVLTFNNMPKYIVTQRGIFERAKQRKLENKYFNSINYLRKINENKFFEKYHNNPYKGFWLSPRLINILIKLKNNINLEYIDKI